jgi:hypothetical protein
MSATSFARFARFIADRENPTLTFIRLKKFVKELTKPSLWAARAF